MQWRSPLQNCQFSRSHPQTSHKRVYPLSKLVSESASPTDSREASREADNGQGNV
jgi:hypothetical protein